MDRFLKNNFDITIRGSFSAPEEFPFTSQKEKLLREKFPSGGCNQFVQKLNNQKVDHEQININHFFDISTKISSYLEDIALYNNCNEKLSALERLTLNINGLSAQVESFSHSPHNESRISTLKSNIRTMKFMTHQLSEKALEVKKVLKIITESSSHGSSNINIRQPAHGH